MYSASLSPRLMSLQMRIISRQACSAKGGRVELPVNWKTRLSEDENSKPVVALGKFDAMHIGHRALAEAAAEMGDPWLVSFSGMAEVMGWDTTRLPLVPMEERSYVLESWKTACGGRTPHMRYLPFSEIRGLSPEEFIQILVNDLGAAGIVTGSNYRFGYKAAGDVCLLRKVASELGVETSIVNLVKKSAETVSSSKVRTALDRGDIVSVNTCLGRNYVLVLDVSKSRDMQFFPASSFLNLPPKSGRYDVLLNCKATSVEIDGRGIRFQEAVESDDKLLRLIFR